MGGQRTRRSGRLRPGKIITQVIVFLLLLSGGAIVNVAVAWGVANLLSERTIVTKTISGPGRPTVVSEHNWPVADTQGWPMRSFSEQVPRDRYPADVTVIELKNAKLAFGPMWPGFAINTLFYAIILWLLIPGPFVLRRVIRLRRGRCPKCGYDLRGKHDAGCSECGWNRQPEAMAE
jgi:hypothetical protein